MRKIKERIMESSRGKGDNGGGAKTRDNKIEPDLYFIIWSDPYPHFNPFNIGVKRSI